MLCKKLICTVIIITEDDLSNVFTVEEGVQKIGFGIFQVLLSFFCGAIGVKSYGWNYVR